MSGGFSLDGEELDSSSGAHIDFQDTLSAKKPPDKEETSHNQQIDAKRREVCDAMNFVLNDNSSSPFDSLCGTSTLFGPDWGKATVSGTENEEYCGVEISSELGTRVSQAAAMGHDTGQATAGFNQCKEQVLYTVCGLGANGYYDVNPADKTSDGYGAKLYATDPLKCYCHAVSTSCVNIMGGASMSQLLSSGNSESHLKDPRGLSWLESAYKHYKAS